MCTITTPGRPYNPSPQISQAHRICACDKQAQSTTCHDPELPRVHLHHPIPFCYQITTKNKQVSREGQEGKNLTIRDRYRTPDHEQQKQSKPVTTVKRREKNKVTKVGRRSSTQKNVYTLYRCIAPIFERATQCRSGIRGQGAGQIHTAHTRLEYIARRRANNTTLSDLGEHGPSASKIHLPLRHIRMFLSSPAPPGQHSLGEGQRQ